jgi:hypothetical protein
MKRFFIAVALVLTTTPALACSVASRPGTPRVLTVAPPRWEPGCHKYELQVEWDNPNVGEAMWWDLYIRDRRGRPHRIFVRNGFGTGNKHGQGGYWRGYVQDGASYCFSVKARTASGTQGCLSLVETDPKCVDLPAAPKAVGKRLPPLPRGHPGCNYSATN